MRISDWSSDVCSSDLGKQWGDTQTRSYVTKLQADMDRIAAGEGFFKDMSTLYPRLRMVHCEHYYIFCLPRDDAAALVFGIFHERMDLMARLADQIGRATCRARVFKYVQMSVAAVQLK